MGSATGARDDQPDQVLLDAKPFKCANAADVTTFAETEFAGDDAQVFVPAIRLHPTLDCTMDVLKSNPSDSDVAVDSISIPMAGPSNGWGVHADRGYPQGMTPAGGRNALDATFDYQHDPRSGGPYPLAADSVTRFTFHLSWSDGCMDDGSAAIFNDAPTAVISGSVAHRQELERRSRIRPARRQEHPRRQLRSLTRVVPVVILRLAGRGLRPLASTAVQAKPTVKSGTRACDEVVWSGRRWTASMR